VNDIKRARLNDFLVRLLGLDVGPPAPYVAGEVNPVVQLLNPLDADLRWARGEKQYGATVDVAAGVNFPQVRLRNPSGSGVVVVVELIIAAPGVALRCVAGMGALTTDLPTLPAAGNYAATDSRAGIVSGTNLNRGAANVTSDNNAPTQQPPNVFNCSVAAGGCFKYERELILAPGSGLDVWVPTAAATFVVSLGWRERSIDALELNA
jgi:hypothetical protein